MPLPIKKVKESYQIDIVQDQNVDWTSLLSTVMTPYHTEQIAEKGREKQLVKDIWLVSRTLEAGKVEVPKNISDSDILTLKMRGLIKGDGRIVEFTAEGSKILRESILNDETFSLTKQASKKMISDNSYDFGNEVLVRVKDAEKFGAKYITIPKKAFKKGKAEPRDISEYKIATSKSNGNPKMIEDYSDEELIQVLHLAKRVIENSHSIITSGSELKAIPIHRIKSFSEMLMKELNNRR